MAGCPLVTVRNFEQRRFAPRASEKLKPGWQCATRETHRYGDGGKTGGRRNPRTVIAMGRIEVADQPRRKIPRGIDKHVQLFAIHGIENGLGKAAFELGDFLAFGILFGREIGCRLRDEEDLFD